MIVLDASVVLELLLRTARGERLVDRVLDPEETLHVPHLLDVEVAHALRRFTLVEKLPAERSREALDDLADLPLIRYPHMEFLSRVWELRGSMTAYDAVYVALAEALDVPLLTSDAKLASAHGHDARIELMV